MMYSVKGRAKMIALLGIRKVIKISDEPKEPGKKSGLQSTNVY